MKIENKNILMFVLLQTLGKTSTAIATQEKDILNILKDALIFANKQFEKEEFFYSDLTSDEAEQEIKNLDGLYIGLHTTMHMLFNLITDKESNEIKKEYHKLIDNMEDLREGLELFTDMELMQSFKQAANGDYSNFIAVA